MTQISLRPEFMTSGGELCGIMVNEQYVGSLTLLYREQDRIWGTVQLDQETIDKHEKVDIDSLIQQYVEDLIDALDVPDCIVTSSFSPYDYIISTENEYDEIEESQYVNSDYDVEPEEDDDLYQLLIVGENKNKIEYQIVDENNEFIAEAMVKIKDRHVKGKVFWNFDPDDEEIDQAAASIVADFDSEQIDTFRIKMYYDEQELVDIDLVNDQLDEEDTVDIIDVYEDEDVPLEFDLIFDDDQTMIFDIYEENHEGIRIGTVTIIKSRRDIKGSLDFINPRDEQLREQISYQLLSELDKELEYDTFSLTMVYLGDVIDEFIFDQTEQTIHIN